MSACKQNCDGLILRILWIALFVLAWRVAELVLLATVLVQLAYRLFSGRPNVDVLNFGDSLSQYLAQMGRFATFHSDEKPWPFADWPAPREPQGEGAEALRAAQAAAAAPQVPAAAPLAPAAEQPAVGADQSAAPAVDEASPSAPTDAPAEQAAAASDVAPPPAADAPLGAAAPAAGADETAGERPAEPKA